MPTRPDTLRDAAVDLVLGGGCVGCAGPGRPLCPSCAVALPRRGGLAWPTPTPTGLAPPYAAGAYDGLLKALVNAHKEHGALALAAPLGRVLSDVVHALLHDLAGPGPTVPVVPVILVPVPSRPSVVRRRGHDPLLRTAREAALRLRRHGLQAAVQQRLVAVGRVRDQAALGADERAANLAGTMRARRPAARGRGPDGVLVVVDDVLTTGATAREAQRALEAAGSAVTGIATVAATRRRLDARPAGPAVGVSAMGAVSYLSPDDGSTVPLWSPPGSVVAPSTLG